MPYLWRDGWSLGYHMRPGGIVLTDVTHQNFNLARDIRTVRVWVDTEYPDRSDGRNLTSFVLHGPELPATDGRIDVLDSTTPGQLVNDTPFFSGFNNQFGLFASYQSTTPYLAGSVNECRVGLVQRLLFTDYGKNPAHEPGGVLDACRLFPMLNFWFPPVRSARQPYPKYFRADYRLDINLDNIDEPALEENRRSGDVVTNKAAIFRDKETLPGWIGQGFGAVRVLLSPLTSGGPNIEEIFAAYEKPLQYEIATWGLVHGQPPPRVTRQHAWDNLHMWPAVRSVDRWMVSTPGAFHALHCHWRWGAVTGIRDPPGYNILAQSGERQFIGVGWSESEGGALVDPRIPKQNLRFAITWNDASRGPIENASERDFFTLFENYRSQPAGVVDGDDLVLWVSFEVFREDSQILTPWTGDLFVNGFYFAHNTDQTPAMVRAGGVYGEGANPSPERRWRRLAKP